MVSLDIDAVVRHHDSGDAKMFPIGKFAGDGDSYDAERIVLIKCLGRSELAY